MMYIDLKVTQSAEDCNTYEGDDEKSKAIIKALYGKDKITFDKLKEFLTLKPEIKFDFSPYPATSDLNRNHAGIYWRSKNKKNKWYGSKFRNNGFCGNKKFEAISEENIDYKLIYNDNTKKC